MFASRAGNCYIVIMHCCKCGVKEKISLYHPTSDGHGDFYCAPCINEERSFRKSLPAEFDDMIMYSNLNDVAIKFDYDIWMERYEASVRLIYKKRGGGNADQQ